GATVGLDQVCDGTSGAVRIDEVRDQRAREVAIPREAAPKAVSRELRHVTRPAAALRGRQAARLTGTQGPERACEVRADASDLEVKGQCRRVDHEHLLKLA